MTEDHRSRAGWTAFVTPPTGVDGPRQRRIGIVILYLAVVLNTVISLLLFSYVLVLKDSRDTEQQRTDQRINEQLCVLLDQFPAGGLLERPRLKYHCGPGLPNVNP